jgi:hypothetical protein
MSWRLERRFAFETTARLFGSCSDILNHADIDMSLSDEHESIVAIAFDQYLAALDAGDRTVLGDAAFDRTRQDARVYRTLGACMSHIEAIDEHDEGTFVTWSVRSADGNVVARFSAIVSLQDDRITIDRLMSREVDEQALSTAAEMVLSAPINSLPRSSQYWVRRWEGRTSIAPSVLPPSISPSIVPPLINESDPSKT